MPGLKSPGCLGNVPKERAGTVVFGLFTYFYTHIYIHIPNVYIMYTYIYVYIYISIFHTFLLGLDSETGWFDTQPDGPKAAGLGTWDDLGIYKDAGHG